MKQTCAILLLAIFSFNWVGYQLVSSIIENKASISLDNKIDQSFYDESQLKEIRVPLNAPYLAGVSADFERYEGEVEVDGINYKYVKRRVDNGDLVLLCLPNEGKTKFQQSRVDFFKLVNDLGHSTSNSTKEKGSTHKSFVTEYRQENNAWTIQHPETSDSNYSDGNQLYFPSSFPSVYKEPPRA